MSNISYRVYEIDEEDGEELSCIREFDNEDKAVKFSNDYSLPNHVVKIDFDTGYTEVIWPKDHLNW